MCIFQRFQNRRTAGNYNSILVFELLFTRKKNCTRCRSIESCTRFRRRVERLTTSPSGVEPSYTVEPLWMPAVWAPQIMWNFVRISPGTHERERVLMTRRQMSRFRSMRFIPERGGGRGGKTNISAWVFNNGSTTRNFRCEEGEKKTNK